MRVDGSLDFLREPSRFLFKKASKRQVRQSSYLSRWLGVFQALERTALTHLLDHTDVSSVLRATELDMIN